MTTARTVQILDANNNNISPATSIESLYFEMTSKNTRYRMSLRSRFMVADSTVDWDDYKKVNPTDYMVPFTYVRAVEGTDNTLWQLTAGKYDVSTIISNYIHNYTNVEYVHAAERADFFYRNGSTGDNTISTDIELTDSSSNVYLTIGMSDDKFGLHWNSSTYLLNDDSGNVNLGAEKTLGINGASLDASAFDYVTIGNKASTQVDVCGKKVNITDGEEATVAVGSGAVAIDTSTKVTISSELISLSATSKVSIPENTSLFIYGKRFPNYVDASEGTLKYLTIDDEGTLAWNDVEKISVKPAGSEEPAVNTFYIKNLQFTDNSSVSLVMDPDNRQDNVRLRTLVDSSSSATAFSLLATEDQKSIYFATVNDKSIISNTRHNYSFVEEGNTIWQNIKRSAATNGVTKTEVNSGKFVTAVTFDNGALGYEQCSGVEFSANNGGQLICRQYVMTNSDKRRKTDIRPVEYHGELPEIVQFRYKDSSALSYGVIAQDVERAGLEHLVCTDSLSTMKSVSYTELLILYIKDLQERNRLLEERVEKLERR